MHQFRCLVILASVCMASAFAACKEETVPPTPAAGSGVAGTTVAGVGGGVAGTTAAGTGGMAGATTAGTGATSCQTVTNDPSLSQALCNNPTDHCFLETHAAEVRKFGGECAAMMCSQFVATPNSAEAVKCFVDCLDMKLKTAFGSSVSTPCLACPQRVVNCSTSNDNGTAACLTQCFTAPDSQTCTDCLCAVHPNGVGEGKPGNCLIDAYADCLGWRPTPQLVGCPATSGG